jgi:hypothetical protein
MKVSNVTAGKTSIDFFAFLNLRDLDRMKALLRGDARLDWLVSPFPFLQNAALDLSVEFVKIAECF